MSFLAFCQDYQLCKGVCVGVYVCTGVCVHVCRGKHFRYSLGQLALQRCVCVGRVCVGAINSATVCVCRVVCV